VSNPVAVHIPTQLRGYTGGLADVLAEGSTLAEVLADLERRYPGFRFRVIDEQDRVRRHIIFFVGVDRQDDLGAVIPPGQPVQIVGALSGG
jgi:molybdopterin converting factor small subunit